MPTTSPHEVARDRVLEELERLREQLVYAAKLRAAEDAGYPAAFGWLKGAVHALFSQFGVAHVVDCDVHGVAECLQCLQAGSGEQARDGAPSRDTHPMSAPAAGEGTCVSCGRHGEGSCFCGTFAGRVSDAEAEAVADAACGAPVDSHVSRAFAPKPGDRGPAKARCSFSDSQARWAMSGDIEAAGRQGWGWPMASRKAHYFIGGMSLCRKWIYTGQLTANQSTERGSDDCAECHRKSTGGGR